jgi:mono/diheme cytochrome c family protein
VGPAKVTADDYQHVVVAAGEGPVGSVTADGSVAPFGMTARAPREVQALPAAAAMADAGTQASSAVYGVQCVACHGPAARGVQGLGPNLAESQLVANSSAAELTAFLKAGRGIDSPDNVSGVPMPSFAWMPQADLDEVTAFLKTL